MVDDAIFELNPPRGSILVQYLSYIGWISAITFRRWSKFLDILLVVSVGDFFHLQI